MAKAGEDAREALPLGADEPAGLPDVGGVPQHQLPRQGGDAADAPGVLVDRQGRKEGLVPGDPVAKAQARGGEEFGHAPYHHQVVKVPGERDGGDQAGIGGELYVGLIHHDEDAPRPAGARQGPEPLLGDGGGGGIVGVAQDDQVRVPWEKRKEVRDVQLKAVLLLQVIGGDLATGQLKLPLVLRVGGADDHRVAGPALADEEGDELRGAVSHSNKRGGDLAVVRDSGLQGGVAPVGIAADDVQVFCQGCFYRGGQAQGIDICPEAGDLLLFDVVIFFNLLQVAAVEGRAFCVFHVYSSCFLLDFSLFPYILPDFQITALLL